MNTKIRSINVLNGGLKGLEVDCLRIEKANDREFENEYSEKRKHPIHMELTNSLTDLRPFFLEILGMDKKEVEDIEVTKITIREDAFLLSGKKKVFDTKTIAVNTPLVDDSDGYKNFDKVMKLIDSIVAETEVHMTGTKQLSDTEILLQFAQSGKKGLDYSIDEIKGLSAEEQKDLCTKILEKMGSIVVHNEDIEVTAEDSNDLLTEAAEKVSGGEEEALVIPGVPRLEA